jgi:hypothetical protein
MLVFFIHGVATKDVLQKKEHAYLVKLMQQWLWV